MAKKDEFELPEVLGSDWGFYRPRNNLRRAKQLEDGRYVIAGPKGPVILSDQEFSLNFVEVSPAKVDNEGHLGHIARGE